MLLYVPTSFSSIIINKHCERDKHHRYIIHIIKEDFHSSWLLFPFFGISRCEVKSTAQSFNRVSIIKSMKRVVMNGIVAPAWVGIEKQFILMPATSTLCVPRARRLMNFKEINLTMISVDDLSSLLLLLSRDSLGGSMESNTLWFLSRTW